jgi:diguanylate cyclase (GGDEF)-like protein
MRSSSPAVPTQGFRPGLEGLLEAAADIAFRLAPTGEIRYASAGAIRLAALASGLRGIPLTALATEADQPVLRNAIADALAGPSAALVEVRLRSHDRETWFELRVAACPGLADDSVLLVLGRDMTAQRATEERLRHMATHDGLTELPNRLLLSDRIRMVIASARRSGQAFAVATVGLDGFKKVNDALGHPVGDEVLRMAAARLRRTLRDSDTLARAGGDEFVAVLPGTASEAQIRLVTARLLAALQSPFEIGEHTIYLGASIGVAVYPQHAEDEVRLVALADVAMSRAKESGRSRCVVYCPRENARPNHDISLEAAMFSAVREGEFLLYYQPIVGARSRKIEGFETLMRWRHPTLGMVPPARFIPIAENNGLINLLGAWALKAACVQVRQFEQAASSTSR